jgi:predicted homoserine dehydrogenase-like protein
MVRVGLISYGSWGPNLLRNFAELSGSQVIAVSDLRTERSGIDTGARGKQVELDAGRMHA